MSDYAGSEMGAEDAFVKSDTHALDDLQLQPYTPAREVAAQKMGLKYPYLQPEDREQFEKTDVYPGALQDIAIVLFLCAPDKTSAARWALTSPMDALEAAIEWAHQRGYTNQRGDKFWPAYNKMVEIVNEAQPKMVPKEEKGAESPKAPRGSRNGPATSRKSRK